MMTGNIVHFEGIGDCFYLKDSFRHPRKGEFYLSGAVIQAYRAPNDLSSTYVVVIPTHHAVRETRLVRGAEVKL